MDFLSQNLLQQAEMALKPLLQGLVPDLFGYGAFALVLFLTLGGAFMAVLHRNIVYNVTGLACSLVGVAGLFIFLGSEFLAIMEIVVYVGAICIAIVFAIMLSVPMQRQYFPRRPAKAILALCVSASAFAAVVGMVAGTTWIVAGERLQDWSIKRLGTLLLTRYELLFELISLVLLVAMIGAIVTASAVRRDQKNAVAAAGNGRESS